MKTELELIAEAYLGMNEARKVSSDRLVFNSDDEYTKRDHSTTMRDMFNVHTAFNDDFTLTYTGTPNKVEKATEYHSKHIPTK